MRVLLSNHWHDDNRGDSAITQGILTLLRGCWPHAKVTVTTLAEVGPLYVGGGRHLVAAFPDVKVLASPAVTELRGRRRARSPARVATDAVVLWLRTLPALLSIAAGRPLSEWRRQVDEHDVVVLVGGSNIFDDSGVPAVLSLPRLVGVLGPAYTAKKRGKPVLLLGHTLGPFARRSARCLAAWMLGSVDLAVVREQSSLAIARAVGVSEVEEAPDMAFALSPCRTQRVTEMLRSLPTAPERTLVLSIRQHPTSGEADDERLVNEFASAARVLVDAGNVDGVAVVAHTVGPTPIEDDRPMSERLVEKLSGLPVAYISEDVSPAEMSAFYGATAGVVAVRLHAAILALTAGAPTFAVAYLTAKTHGVMQQVGLGDAVAEFRTVTADDIVSGVRRLLADVGLRDRLAAAAVERRELMARSSFRWFGNKRQPVTAGAGGLA
jgi:colanic acid/amylovoran biosynthesis protein